MKSRCGYVDGDWGAAANEWRRALEGDNKSPSAATCAGGSIRSTRSDDSVEASG